MNAIDSPVGPVVSSKVGHDEITFFLTAIKLRSAFMVFITDHPSGMPGLGNMALSSPTRLDGQPVVSTTLPFMKFKYEIIAKSLNTLLGRKLHAPVFLILDVHFEPTDPKPLKALKEGILSICKKMEPVELDAGQ